MIAGVAAALKRHPKNAARGIRVWGVQPNGADSMVRSLEQNKIVTIDLARTVADGEARSLIALAVCSSCALSRLLGTAWTCICCIFSRRSNSLERKSRNR